jgi:pantoate--beta-alanine ligase
MQVIRTVAGMAAWSMHARSSGQRIGLVPTMGYLHEGHLSLVRLAREQCGVVVLSIFVNPTQFLPGEDIDRYPRDFERDAALCQEAGVDVIFHPVAGEMYADDHSVMVDETRLSAGLCGASRPGHFRGVVTVVAKLLNIVQPEVAVFGQKDAQQVRVIQRLVRDLNFQVRVVVGPIIREPDGLAMSSRNKYLSPVERQDALCLRRALDRAEGLFAAGERDASVLRSAMFGVIADTPSAVVDYLEIVDDDTLEPLGRIGCRALVVMAVRIGKTRLLDNAVLSE